MIGTKDQPHVSAEPMAIARDIIHGHFTDGQGGRTLFEHRGTIWHWEGRWRPRSRTWLLDTVCLLLEGSFIRILTRDGAVVEPLLEKKSQPKVVCERIETITRVDEERAAPFWLKGEGTGGETMVTFRDQLVDVGGDRVLDVGPGWFDPVSLNAKYVPGAKCPLWEKSLAEWSGGDPEWVDLLQRLFGYAILPTRKFQKWFLFYGVPRSGKGTVLHTLRALMGGNVVMSKGLSDLVGAFGLDGLESARVLIVNEVHHLDKGEGSKASSIVKQLVGQDPISVNIKYVRPLRNIESRALPILQSNEIPTLEDKAGGLSSKMVLVPFSNSFLDHENEDLAAQLKGEMTGIAQWALHGAWKVLHRPGTQRFPMLRAAQDAVDDYIMAVNSFNRFLGDYFEEDGTAWVAFDVVWQRWMWWTRDEVVSPGVTRYTLTRKLLEGTNWKITRARRAHGAVRGFSGMKLRYIPPKVDDPGEEG